MKCCNYYDLDQASKEAFYEFLREAYLEKDTPAHVNMWDDNWETNVSTLPYILEKTNRFKFGLFNVLFNGEEVVACSGVYESDFCNELAIAGVRTWIKEKYRNQNISREFLLPAEKNWAKINGYKAIGLTFNSYNKNLIKTWQKRRLGENRTQRQPYHIFYNNLNVVDFLVTIQYTPQYIIYERLTDSFTFNWDQIKYLDESR